MGCRQQPGVGGQAGRRPRPWGSPQPSRVPRLQWVGAGPEGEVASGGLVTGRPRGPRPRARRAGRMGRPHPRGGRDGWAGPPRPVVPARPRGAQLQLCLESNPRVDLRGTGFRLRGPLSCRRVLPLSLNPRPPRRGEAGPPPGAPPSFVPAPLSGSPQPPLSSLSTRLPPAPLEAPGPGPRAE